MENPKQTIDQGNLPTYFGGRKDPIQVKYPAAPMHSTSPGPEGMDVGLAGHSMYQTSRGRQCKPTEKMEGFIDLKRKKKVERVPNLPLPPEEPDVLPQLKKSQRVIHPKPKQSKAFINEGPTLHEQPSPASTENPFEKLGVKLLQPSNEVEVGNSILGPPSGTQPVTGFVKGCVKLTTEEGLKTMVAELKNLPSGTSGCIINENFQPDADAYLEDIHFIVDKNLGKGSNGMAQLCYDSKSGLPYVRKMIQKSALRKSEVLVPLNLDHKNITKFYGLIQRENFDGTLQMELMLEYAGTALNVYMKDNHLIASEIWDMTEQGLRGLQQFNYFGMIHLDIKPENICLVKSNGELVLKITDFGSAKLPQEEISFAGWTPEYMAPESCQLVLQMMQPCMNFGVDQDSITSKVDVFGFALVVMYFYKRYHILQRVITNGKTTYGGIPPDEVKALQTKLMINLATENLVENFIPDEVDLEMRDLLQRMTIHRYKDRLDAEQAMEIVIARKKQQSTLKKQQIKQTNQRSVKMEDNPVIPSMTHGYDMYIPDVAINQMDMETGPIRNMTKDKLRQKLKNGPYPAAVKKSGKGFKTIPPQTPVEEMKMLTLSNISNSQDKNQGAEMQMVTQASHDTDFITTNGSMVAVQMDSVAPSFGPTVELLQMEETYIQPTDRITGVPILVCEDSEDSQIPAAADKLWDGMFVTQEEYPVVNVISQMDPTTELLMKLTKYFKMTKTKTGSVDKTGDRQPAFERALGATMVPITGPVQGALPATLDNSPTTVQRPAWGTQVDPTAVNQGNIPNFCFL